MTADKTRKSAIRQRMAQTGEPYSVARHAVLADYAPPKATGTLPDDHDPADAPAEKPDAGADPEAGPDRAWGQAAHARLLAEHARELAEQARMRPPP